jgi:hypothetical protein
MEEARTTFLNQSLTTVSGWINSNRWVALAGALTTVFGLIIGANNVIPLVMEGLNLPACITYATQYCTPNGCFKHEGNVWREYQPIGGPQVFEFREFQRTREVIDLINLTPRPTEPHWATLLVRLPVCGGTARLTAGIPEHWIDLAEVRRQ